MMNGVQIGSIDVLPGDVTALISSSTLDLLTIPEDTQMVGTNKVVKWGADNNLPQSIMEKVANNDVVSRNLEFLTTLTYGQGVKPYIKTVVSGKTYYELCTNQEVNDFFEENDLSGYFLEQCSDLCAFSNVFPEIILSNDKKKIVSLTSKEATFSRWCSANERTGQIDKHIYSAQWGETVSTNNSVESNVLPRINPYKALLEAKGSKSRFIMNINFPTPGRVYYQQPSWWSIFNSGSYDFSSMLWKFKKALLKNGLAVRYIIYISPSYWVDMLKEKGISEADVDAVKKAKDAELERFRVFLTSTDNEGKGIFVGKKMLQNGNAVIEEKLISIEEVKVSGRSGGEYLEDSSEASNTISYAMGVYQQLIGTSPGKTGGSLSGTDKREMFLIASGLRKASRDRLLQPLYLIKKYNGWPAELEFLVEDLQFTTLDVNKSGKTTTAS